MVAEASADYYIKSEDPLVLIHIRSDYYAHPALIRGLLLEDVQTDMDW